MRSIRPIEEQRSRAKLSPNDPNDSLVMTRLMILLWLQMIEEGIYWCGFYRCATYSLTRVDTRVTKHYTRTNRVSDNR